MHRKSPPEGEAFLRGELAELNTATATEKQVKNNEQDD